MPGTPHIGATPIDNTRDRSNHRVKQKLRNKVQGVHDRQPGSLTLAFFELNRVVVQRSSTIRL